MNEHGFVKAFHKKLSKKVYKWKILDMMVGGIPDAWYCGNENQAFIEFKYLDRLPEQGEVDLGLSKLQVKWIEDRVRQNAHVFLVVAVESYKQCLYITPNEIRMNHIWFKPDVEDCNITTTNNAIHQFESLLLGE